MEGLEVADADLMVYIHPSKANKVRQAILRQLSSLLFTIFTFLGASNDKPILGNDDCASPRTCSTWIRLGIKLVIYIRYDEIFDGVILAYEVHIRSRSAKILPGLIPYFGVKLKATLLRFSPRPNMLLEGKVVKLGKESVHVIVLGFCSAAIMLDDIREEFKYKIKDGVGVFASKSNKRHAIKAGSMIRFLVKSLDEEILHISGSLIPPHTGCIRWLSKHGVENGPRIDRNLKRHRERDIEKEVQDQHPGLLNEGDQSLDHNHLRKSRRRTAEE